MKKILLLEDDPLLSSTVEDLLVEEGYNVTLVQNGEDAADACYESTFDLYLFDVNVPKLNGFELLKSLREAQDKTPTFFITALADLKSLQEGFNVGADDYIKKPFDMFELLIRIQAKLRVKEQALHYKEVTLLPNEHRIVQNDVPVDLPHIQYNIFTLLLENLGQTVDTSHLLELLETPSAQALRVHITKLKSTLHLELTNIRGVGYRLEKPTSQERKA